MSIRGHNQYGPFFIDHDGDIVNEIKSLCIMLGVGETFIIDSINLDMGEDEGEVDEH